MRLNNAVFGELFVVISHIGEEPSNMYIWQKIHPIIVKIPKNLFCDGHYDAAAERAVKEVESRLRELFHTLNPNATVPTKVSDVINALLSDNGLYQFTDATVSDENYRRGIKSLFEGIIAAYRNPSPHENIPCTKREAIE